MLEHYIQIPGSGHAVAAGRGHPYLRQYCVHPALRDENVVGGNRLVVLPPAAQGECLGRLMAVHRKGDGKLCPQLRFHPQQLQDTGVGGRLVGALLGEPPHHRFAVHPVGFIGIGVADLHMGLVERLLRGHAQKAAQPPLGDQRIVL